jgi:protoporphyrinogen oxidase
MHTTRSMQAIFSPLYREERKNGGAIAGAQRVGKAKRHKTEFGKKRKGQTGTQAQGRSGKS